MEKDQKHRKFKQQSDTPLGKHYTVQAGDTLSAIALEFYGDASQYMKIYQANKDLIGDDPDLIKVGQELIIPPNH